MSEKKTIREMPVEDVMQMLRNYSVKIGLLAQRGEPLSKKVKEAYEHLYDHQSNSTASNNFRDAFQDWMKQHLEVSARLELARKYGYLVDGEDPSGATKIVTLQ